MTDRLTAETLVRLDRDSDGKWFILWDGVALFEVSHDAYGRVIEKMMRRDIKRVVIATIEERAVRNALGALSDD